MARHVFAETNWVVDIAAPMLSRNPGATKLLARAAAGELTIHVPSISLAEARKVIRERPVRSDLVNVRAFVANEEKLRRSM